MKIRELTALGGFLLNYETVGTHALLAGSLIQACWLKEWAWGTHQLPEPLCGGNWQSTGWWSTRGAAYSCLQAEVSTALLYYTDPRLSWGHLSLSASSRVTLELEGTSQLLWFTSVWKNNTKDPYFGVRRSILGNFLRTKWVRPKLDICKPALRAHHTASHS